jgi:hypothetical protein
MEAKDILQINSTVIAGAVIFLSLSVVLIEESEKELEEEQEQQEQQRLNNLTNTTNATTSTNNRSSSSVSDDDEDDNNMIRSNSHAFIAFLIIVPFAVSSIMAIVANGIKIIQKLTINEQ